MPPLFALPLFGWVATRWLFMAPEWCKWRADTAALAEWNGRFYVFDDRQVRVLWDASQTCLVARDIFSLLGREPDRRRMARIAARVGRDDFRPVDGSDEICVSDDGAVRYLGELAGDETAVRVWRWLDAKFFRTSRSCVR